MSMEPGRRKILVADDLPDAADITVELLRLAGYDAAAAYDGLQAIEAARVFRPDLAILDIDMPGMNGYETARRLRQQQRPGSRLVLIAHMGRTTPSDVQLALDAGFDRHLGKPLAGTHLCDLIAAFVEDQPSELGQGSHEIATRPTLSAMHPDARPGDQAEER